jgi:hypothetical protein
MYNEGLKNNPKKKRMDLNKSGEKKIREIKN